MKCKILETGEIRYLSCYDVEGKIDCSVDIVGNPGTIFWDEKDEIYEISSEDYEWWSEYLRHCEDDTRELARLRRELCTTEEACDRFENLVVRFGPSNGDMEGEHDKWWELFRIIREELG